MKIEPDIEVRPACLDDADGINAVYNPYIRDTAVTFETVEHTTDHRAAWLRLHVENPRHPVFVAKSAAGAICGFVSASAFDPRGAYETSVKTSVFLTPDMAGRGIGGALYDALFQALERADVHRAYALVVAPNPASVALHVRSGFTKISTLSEVGRKFGRFHDVMWFEKRL